MGYFKQGWVSEGSFFLYFYEFEIYKEGDIWMFFLIEKCGFEKVGFM